jgi:hypothetical protein
MEVLGEIVSASDNWKKKNDISRNVFSGTFPQIGEKHDESFTECKNQYMNILNKENFRILKRDNAPWHICDSNMNELRDLMPDKDINRKTLGLNYEIYEIANSND